MRHALDEISHGAGFQGLVDILVALVGCEHDETGLRSGPADGTDDVHSTLIRKPEVHQSDVRPMLPEQAYRFLCSSRLPGYRHVGLRLNDGGNAEAHNRVIVADEDFNLLFITHICMV